MTKFRDLIVNTRRLLDDPDGNFYSDALVQKQLEAAELLITITRGLSEKSGYQHLDIGVPDYDIHINFPRWIVPLRISIGGRPLYPAKFQSIVTKDPHWRRTFGVPEFYFNIGMTRLGYYPTPDAGYVAHHTYLRVPPIGQPLTENPVIPEIFHSCLPHYAASVLFATEGDVMRAQEEMLHFLKSAGFPRDMRFLPDLQVKNPKMTGAEVEPISDSKDGNS